MLDRQQSQDDDFHVLDAEQAYDLTGLAPEQLKSISDTTVEFGSADAPIFMGFRMGNGVDLSLECAPKSTDVHAKSSTVGPVDGYIPVKQYLARRDPDSNGSYKIRAYNYAKDFKLDVDGKVAMPEIHMNLSIGAIIAGLHSTPPKYTLATSLTDLEKTGELKVHPYHVNPAIQKTISELVFSVQLNDLKNSTPAKIPAKNPVSQPNWWQPQWGSFDGNRHYATYSQENSQSKPEPLMVYGTYKTENQIIPVRRDLDALILARKFDPANPAGTLPQRFLTEINTFPTKADPFGGGTKLIKALIALDKHLLGDNSTLKMDDINSTIINRLGNITPLEAYMTMKLNVRFNKSIPHVENLLQHASENHNPGPPSDINDRMFFVWGNKFVVTNNEKGLVNFLMNAKGLLETNTFDVHPKWNPELWASIVALQVVLGQKQEKDIPKEFKDYLQNAANLNPKLWQPVAEKLAAQAENKNIPDYIRAATKQATQMDVEKEGPHYSMRSR